MATTTSYVTPGPLGYNTPPLPADGVTQTYTTETSNPINNNKGGDDTAELRRRVQYLEERMTRTEPAGVSQKSLAEAVGSTPSSHASVVANPAPLGLFAFGLTTAMLSVRVFEPSSSLVIGWQRVPDLRR